MKPKFVIKNIQDNSPTKSPSKIKINSISDLPYDPSKAEFFKNLFQTTVDTIQGDINIDALNENGRLNYQVWKVEFRAEEPYANKKIQGQLRFPNNYPNEAPKFYFNKLKENKLLEHLNIYGDGLLCIPLLGVAWKSTTTTIDILEAIVHIFNNPNWTEDDAPANPILGEINLKANKGESLEEQQEAKQKLGKIYEAQVPLMEDWD